jgi:tetratricopeptide (TPR) repeat protein
MVVLLGVLLGVFVFRWADEWLGLPAAIAVLVFYTLEPNIAAHASLVTTDLAVTCFMFAAVYFLWHTCDRPTAWNIAATSVFAALAMVTKFSAAVLLPVIGILLVTSALQRHGLTPRRAAGVAAAVAVASFIAIWAVYDFRYEASAAGGWSFQLQETEPRLGESAIAGAMLWIDSLRLLPNAFTQGFIYNQGSVQNLGMFLAGEYSTDGWWYYFPFAFLIKTPIALLALFSIGVAALISRRRETGWRTVPFIVVPAGVYLAFAMASGINIGLRHILPIYPFVLLLAAAGTTALVTRGQAGRIAAAALTMLLVVEVATTYPYTLTFFNQLAGGPQNGFRYLADSNLGWGQNLKGLKRWMDRNGVTHINLAYFGQADPEYYGIHATYLPGSPSFRLMDIRRPQLPGYVAIGSTVLSGVYLQPHWRLFYRPFSDLAPVAVVGNSIRVYWLERWPEATGRYGDVPDVSVHRALADTLLFGQQWPTRALRHYREYLSRRPADVDAMVNAAIATASTGDTGEAMSMLRRAVETDPDNGAARLALAKGSFGAGDLRAAARHGERAAVLRPNDADAHDLLGRVRAVQGRFDEAIEHFRFAISLDPTFEPARDHLAQATAMARHR